MTKPVDIRNVKVGAFVNAVSARVEVTHSTPPAPYNEATLLDDMLHASRYAETEADAVILGMTNGIGTARTRSESILDLIRNGTLERQAAAGASSLRLSAAGKKLVGALPPELKSVALTAKWEILLRQVERGQLPKEDFARRNQVFVGLVVKDVKERKIASDGATTPLSCRGK